MRDRGLTDRLEQRFQHLLLNPYQLISSGSMLIGTDHGSQLVDALAKEGIHASVIGKAVEGNDRVIFNDGEKRFLEPPKADELYRAFD